ncbi:MAG TPA: hypothetical protein VIL63_08320 [Terriglobales bacterium]
MDRHPRLAIFRKDLRFPDRGDFLDGAHEGIHRIAQRGFQVFGNLRFQLIRLLHPAREEDIPTRDECLDTIEPKFFEEGLELTHRQPSLAQVYPAEKSNVSRHARSKSVCLESSKELRARWSDWLGELA